MYKNIKCIEAKKKAINVIRSCKTYEQYSVALNYINLYLIMFNDNKGFNELIKEFQVQDLIMSRRS